MTLDQLKRALGGEISNGQLLAPGPGHSSKDRSLWVRLSPDAPDGFLVGSFAKDDWRDCKDYVRRRLGMPALDGARTRCSEPTRRPIKPAPTDDDERRRQAALRVWSGSQNARGTIVETYLTSRKLEFPDDVSDAVLRFHPNCPWREGEATIFVPAMIAQFRDIMTDKPMGIHRTRLTTDGRKVDRRMLGTAAGAAIKLDGDADVTTGLTIGEGIETCLAARQLGFRPVWALGSVGAIGTFPVLPAIEALTLLAETGDASARATEQCAAQWHAAGRDVVIVDPIGGSDLNDAICEAAA